MKIGTTQSLRYDTLRTIVDRHLWVDEQTEGLVRSPTVKEVEPTGVLTHNSFTITTFKSLGSVSDSCSNKVKVSLVRLVRDGLSQR